MSVSTTMSPARAGLGEVAAFNTLVVAPNLVQGLFHRDATAAHVATAADVDGRAVRLLSSMSRRHGGRPLWVRAGLTKALLLLDPDDVAKVLDGSVDDYAADPESKRRGMVHFQPDALTISRGDQWRDRRRFTEAVLRTVPGLAGRIADCAREEAQHLIAERGEITWKPWNRMCRRIARRVILGDAAAEDTVLSDTLERMMSAANRLPGKPSGDLPAFRTSVEAYLRRAEAGSLAASFADAPVDETTEPAAQVTHWLFALGDTLASNTIRALALTGQRPAHRTRGLADDTGAYLAACLQETMRLWPTTALLSRETRIGIGWHGTKIPAGTQILIVNTFCHRDPDRIQGADTFLPGQWLDGDRPSFTHFSRGPQVCPGVDLALLVGRTVLRIALEHTVAVAAPRLPAEKPLPHMLDYFAVRVAVA